MNIRLLLVLAFVPLFIVGCDNQNTQKKVNSGKYEPVANSQPKYFIKIKTKSTKTTDKIKLFAILTYQAHSDVSFCNDIASAIEGAISPKVREVSYVFPDILGKQIKHAKIPIDYYLPGICKWRLSGIDLGIIFNNGNKIYFSDPIPFLDKNDPILKRRIRIGFLPRDIQKHLYSTGKIHLKINYSSHTYKILKQSGIFTTGLLPMRKNPTLSIYLQ